MRSGQSSSRFTVLVKALVPALFKANVSIRHKMAQQLVQAFRQDASVCHLLQPVLLLLDPGQIEECQRVVLSAADFTLFDETFLEDLLASGVAVPPFSAREAEQLAKIGFLVHSRSASEAFGKWLAASSHASELIESSASVEWATNVLRLGEDGSLLSAEGLAFLVSQSAAIREKFASWLASQSSLVVQTFWPILALVRADDFQRSHLSALGSPFYIETMRISCSGSAKAQRTLARLASLAPAEILETFRDLLSGIEPSSLTSNHFDTAGAIALNRLDAPLATELLHKAMSWLVRRFAEDETHLAATADLVQAISKSISACQA
jgi:hypothetical protein